MYGGLGRATGLWNEDWAVSLNEDWAGVILLPQSYGVPLSNKTLHLS